MREIQNRAFAQRLVTFSNLGFFMSDVDLFSSFNGRGFALLEVKTVPNPKRNGQIRAFEQMTLATGQTKPCLFAVAIHEDLFEEGGDIDAAICLIHSVYYVGPATGLPEVWRASDHDLKLTVNDLLAAYAFGLGVPYNDKLGADVPLILSDPESPFVALDGLALLAEK